MIYSCQKLLSKSALAALYRILKAVQTIPALNYLVMDIHAVLSEIEQKENAQ
jgi:hypothetical protein